MNIYCLDFDGVLCDSMDECLLVSYSAHRDKIYSSVSEVTEDYAAFFHKYRYLVRPAREFCLLQYAWDAGLRKLSHEKFTELKNIYADEVEQFHEKFYHYRQLLKWDINRWLAYHKLFGEVRSFLDVKPRFFVVSNKDRDSIEKISDYHGYRDLIIDIYGCDISNDKRILLAHLVDEHDLKEYNIIFVDDNIDNLNETANSPHIDAENAYLASWGYTGVTEDMKTNKVICTLDKILG